MVQELLLRARHVYRDHRVQDNVGPSESPNSRGVHGQTLVSGPQG
jgi:hypothetical protein